MFKVMFIDSLTHLYNGRFKKLNARDRRLVICFGIVVLFSLYFGVSFKPNLDKTSNLKKQNLAAKKRLELLVAQFPNPEETKEQVRGYYDNLETIKSRTKEIEGQLLGISSVPKLVKELITNAQGKKIDFQSVKQKIEEAKDGYSRLDVEVEFDSQYKDMLGYLATIERLSPFVKIDGIDVAQSKSDPANLVTTSLKLTAIISPVSQLQGELSAQAEQAGVKKIELKRSPLTPSIEIGKAKKKKMGIKLIGITFRKNGASSSAIINNTVVKEGDEFEGVRVEKISPDSVTINDGSESENLTVER